MSPGPSRRRWDKDKIVTDLAQEDSEDDDVINPKPDKVEIVRKGSYPNPDIDEVNISQIAVKSWRRAPFGLEFVRILSGTWPETSWVDKAYAAMKKRSTTVLSTVKN